MKKKKGLVNVISFIKNLEHDLGQEFVYFVVPIFVLLWKKLFYDLYNYF